ncbi:MAG: cytochrome c oxidase assembly protein [Acidimicrobiales bacterium]
MTVVGVLLHGTISPPVRVHELLTAWQTGWTSIVALAIEVGLVLWYVSASIRLEARGRHWSRWRTASFLGASVLVIVALQSGLASYDDSVFTVHVVQHLILMNFAPVLYALAAPMTLALQSSSRSVQQKLLKVLHNPVVEAVTHPVVVVAVAYGTMLVYFLTPFYQFTLEHPLLHELTHLHFLISGSLFWWLVVGLDPSRWRLGIGRKIAFLAVGIPVTAILGATLTGASTSIAPKFHSLADTHQGGSILWIVGELVTFAAIGVVMVQWMHYDERQAARLDRQLDAAEAAEAEQSAALAGVPIETPSEVASPEF